jgi:hypothetical protein
MTCRGASGAGVGGQKALCPKLVRIAQMFGLHTGLADQP